MEPVEPNALCCHIKHQKLFHFSFFLFSHLLLLLSFHPLQVQCFFLSFFFLSSHLLLLLSFFLFFFHLFTLMLFWKLAKSLDDLFQPHFSSSDNDLFLMDASYQPWLNFWQLFFLYPIHICVMLWLVPSIGTKINIIIFHETFSR